VKPTLAAVAEALSGRVPNLVVMDAVDSTHAMALRLIEQMDSEGLDLAATLILSGEQGAGQGRGDRRWISPADGLFLNWVRSGLSGGLVAQLPMLAAAAAHAALAELGIGNAVVKWPNDLLVRGRKIAGILTHARHSDAVWATIGLGLNLCEAPVLHEAGHPAATSLEEILGEGDAAARAASFASSFHGALEAALEEPGPALERWRSALLHQAGDALVLRLASGETLSGSFAGTTTEGYLRLQCKGGERVLTGGDILETS
jgi:BirA family biotin operon repressor/biotin-[acetyl-CoA-carboxylase] ligase